MIVDQFGHSIKLPDLLANLCAKVRPQDVEQLRAQFREEIYDQLRSQIEASKLENFRTPNSKPRIEFAQKFYLYQGLSRYYSALKASSEKARLAFEIT